MSNNTGSVFYLITLWTFIGNMLFSKQLVPTKAIIVSVLIAIVLLLPFMHVTSHNPLLSIKADVERHLALGGHISKHLAHSHYGYSKALAAPIQQHAHNNEAHAGSTPEHQHAHNSGDHTHNFAFLSADSPSAVRSLGFWPYAYQRSHLSHPSMQWQRPPRHFQRS